MFLKTLMVSTALSAALLMLDVADPGLSGTTAQAAQVHAASRPAFHAAPRAAPRSVQRSNVVRSNRVVRSRTTTTRTRTTTIKRANVNRGTTTIRSNTNVRMRHVTPTQAVVRPGGLRLGPTGAAARLGPGPAGVPRSGKFVMLNNKAWPIHSGPHKIWWHGGWRAFLPFTALSAVVIGGAYYWPSAYVSVARPYCAGVTPDGCQLNWQMVGFEGGGGEWQCVQYCGRPGVPPPPQAVALTAPPPVAAGGKCELTIFAEPGFAGLNAPTGEDQPHLGEVGWKNQIASIQVQSGTWDFFTEDEFAGENMRLAPGPYPQLGPEWTKRIGSFMCVQGG